MSRQKVAAYGDNRLYALNLVASELAKSEQPLVPEKLVMLGGGENGQIGAQAGVFQAMMQLLTAWETLKEEPLPGKPESEAPPLREPEAA